MWEATYTFELVEPAGGRVFKGTASFTFKIGLAEDVVDASEFALGVLQRCGIKGSIFRVEEVPDEYEETEE